MSKGGKYTIKEKRFMEKKKFYITTSIAYVNAPPHIGFALELIQADVLARYHRLLGQDTYFLTGTDEHGIKNVKTAKEQGITPKELADKNSQKFQELCEVLNISNDDFIRTADQKRHWPSVEKVWKKLQGNGDIYLKKYKGLYCSGCEAFLTEKELEEGKCPIHQKEPEVVEEENYFFRLSKYEDRIRKAIESKEFKIVPQSRANEILGFIKQGLEDISFSRPRIKLDWGIPVPGDNSQTIYVWADALINYISGLDYASESELFQKYWPADVQCVGKDITRFHAIFWPAILFSLKLPLPKILFVHGFITVEGQKMAKSLGNIIDPFYLVEKYGKDALRYYLLREISPFEDGDFTYKKFEERYNADLANGLGNLVARVITMAEKWKNQNGKIKRKNQNAKINEIIEKSKKQHKKFLDDFKFNEALGVIWNLISFCDRYIEKERPWELKNQKVIADLLILLTKIADLLQPFLPETSEKILKQVKTQKKVPLFPRLK